MNCPPQTGPPSFPGLYNPLRENYRDCSQDPRVQYLHSANDIFRFTLYWTLILFLPVFALPGIWALVVHFVPGRIRRSNSTEMYDTRKARQQHLGGTTSPTSISSRRVVSPVVGAMSPVIAYAEPEISPMILSPHSSSPFLLQPPSPAQRPAFPRWNSWTPSRTLRNIRKRTPIPPTSPDPVVSPTPVRNSYPSSSRRSSGTTITLLLVPIVFIIICALLGVLMSLVTGYLLAALHSAAQVRISTWIPLGWAIVMVHTVVLGGFSSMISFI